MNASTAKTLLAIALSVALLAGCGGRTDDAPVGPGEPLPPQAPEGQPAAAAGPEDDAAAGPADGRPDAMTREQRDLGDADAGTAAAPGAADGADSVFGRWTVTGHRMGAVSALDDGGASQLHGRELLFAADRVESGADVCASPRFTVREANVVEFLLTEFRSTPLDLGLQVPADSRVTVVDSECADQPWVTLGSRVLVLPDGRALAPWDGVFFELSSGG